MRAIRTVVVGCGAITQSKYVPALLALHREFDVRLVVNPSAAPREFVAGHFPGASAAAELPLPRELQRDFDAALVLTPPEPRLEYALRCFEAGLPVLAEKPLALLPAEAQEIVDAAGVAGCPLLVAHTRRYDPAYELLAQELEPEKVLSATAATLETRWQPLVELAPLGRDVDQSSEVTRALAGSEGERLSAGLGVESDLVLRIYRRILVESLIHDVDLIASLLGPPERIDFCRALRDGLGIFVQAAFSGVPTALSWSFAEDLQTYDQRFEFIGPGRRDSLRYPSSYLLYDTATLTTDVPSSDGTGMTAVVSRPSREDAFVRLLREFAAVAGGEAEPRMDAADAVSALNIVAACARSMAQGIPIAMSPV